MWHLNETVADADPDAIGAGSLGFTGAPTDLTRGCHCETLRPLHQLVGQRLRGLIGIHRLEVEAHQQPFGDPAKPDLRPNRRNIQLLAHYDFQLIGHQHGPVGNGDPDAVGAQATAQWRNPRQDAFTTDGQSGRPGNLPEGQPLGRHIGIQHFEKPHQTLQFTDQYPRGFGQCRRLIVFQDADLEIRTRGRLAIAHHHGDRPNGSSTALVGHPRHFSRSTHGQARGTHHQTPNQIRGRPTARQCLKTEGIGRVFKPTESGNRHNDRRTDRRLEQNIGGDRSDRRPVTPFDAECIGSRGDIGGGSPAKQTARTHGHSRRGVDQPTAERLGRHIRIPGRQCHFQKHSLRHRQVGNRIGHGRLIDLDDS